MCVRSELTGVVAEEMRMPASVKDTLKMLLSFANYYTQ